MKLLLSIIIFSCCVFATAQIETLTAQEKREPEDNEYSGNDEETEEWSCHEDVYDCLKGLAFELDRTEDYMNTIKKIRVAGPGEFCREVIVEKECLSAQLSQPKCQNLREDIRSRYEKTIELAEYVCIRKHEDISKHWNCFLDHDVVSWLRLCKSRVIEQRHALNRYDRGCKFSRDLTQCFQDVITASSVCQPGASEVARDIVSTRLNLSLPCPQFDDLGNILKRAWMDG